MIKSVNKIYMAPKDSFSLKNRVKNICCFYYFLLIFLSSNAFLCQPEIKQFCYLKRSSKNKCILMIDSGGNLLQ